jgi:hypothetical protein
MPGDKLLSTYINTRKNPESLLDASKEAGLEQNTETTKHMVMSLHQNVEQTHNKELANETFQNMVSSNIWK